MHIALITDGITPYVTGGMQRHSFHLAKRLLKQGVKLTLVHTIPYKEDLPRAEKVRKLLGANADQIDVVAIPFFQKGKLPGHYLRESYEYACAIYRALESQWTNFDFIYAKGYTAWCLLEKKKKGEHIAPIGVKFHGYEMFQKAKGLKTRSEQFMLKPPVVFINRNADVVFSYGGEITEIITQMGVDQSRIVEIGSGIDDVWLVKSPAKKEARRFLFIGRDERRKGISELIVATKNIAELGCEMHWVGPISPQKRTNEAGHVYHGEITDSEQLKAIIDSCDVLVVPSHSEGMPNVILEAMSRGLAVIATSVGAVPRMVSDKNGILIEPRNAKMLEKAIGRLAIAETDDLRILQRESLKIVEASFLWDKVGRQTIEAIRTITHSQPQS